MHGAERIAAAQCSLRAALPREVLRQLERPRRWRVACDFAIDWGGIGLGVSVAAWWPGVIGWLLAALLIGTSQYRLFVLGHDGLHGCLHPTAAVNDRLARWLVYAPLLTNLHDSRRNHLLHHERLGHADDPERYLYRLHDKNSRRRLALLCTGMLTFGRTIERVVPFRAIHDRASVLAALRHGVPALVAQAGLLSAFLAIGLPVFAYPLLWLAPIFVFVYLPDEIRSFCDHAVLVLPDEVGDPHRLVTYRPGWIERWLLSPHGVCYQAEHHAVPTVPYHNLPRVAAALQSRDEIVRRAGYVGFLRQAFGCVPLRPGG